MVRPQSGAEKRKTSREWTLGASVESPEHSHIYSKTLDRNVFGLNSGVSVCDTSVTFGIKVRLSVSINLMSLKFCLWTFV